MAVEVAGGSGKVDGGGWCGEEERKKWQWEGR